MNEKMLFELIKKVGFMDINLAKNITNIIK